MSDETFNGMKTAIIIIAIALTAIAIGIKANTVENTKDIENHIGQEDELSWENCVHIFTGPETGVQYIFYNHWGKAGICPRYNKKGEIMIET